MDAVEIDKIIQVLKNDYRTAEEWLLFYNERENQYKEDCSYILDESPAFRDTGRAASSGNGWTEYKVVQLVALDDTEKWLITVKMLEAMLSPKKQVFLEMRRRAAQENKTLQAQGRRKMNWLLFVQQHYAATMAKMYGAKKDEFWLSENTISAWWKEIVNVMRLIAMKRKCTF